MEGRDRLSGPGREDIMKLMMPDSNRKQLVRGYLVYSQWRAGLIGLDQAKDDECLDVGVAYTHWHRHDEDPMKVAKELNRLYQCYSDFDGYEGCAFGYEYRDYKR